LQRFAQVRRRQLILVINRRLRVQLTVKRWLKVMDGIMVTMPACLTVKTNEERRAYCDLLCDIVLFKKKNFGLWSVGGYKHFHSNS